MSNVKILVIDEEKNIRLTVTHALEALNYLVRSASNSVDGMRQLELDIYDLILVDLKIPGMNAIEFLEKAIAVSPNMRIVIISAQGKIDNVREVMKLATVDFLKKPFTPQELRAVVENVLKR